MASSSPSAAEEPLPQQLKPFDFPIVANMRGKCGYIGSKGEVAIPAKFDYADPFGPFDLARVQVGEKYGFIDKSGKIVIPIIYDQAEGFGKAGLIKVERDGKESVIDHHGTLTFAIPEGAFMSDFGDSDITSYTPPESETTGFVDRNGNMILPAIWEFAFGFGTGSIAPVEKDGKWGYIDKSGKVIVEPIYDQAYSVFLSSASVSIGEQEYEIDGVSGQVLPKLTADGFAIGRFNKAGYAEASKEISKRKSLFGIVDRSLNWILPPIYEYLYVDDDPLQYPATLKGKQGFVDLKGQFTPAMIGRYYSGFDGTEFAISIKNGKEGLVDRKGNWAVTSKFKALGYCKIPPPPKLIPVPPIQPVIDIAHPPSIPSD